MRLSTVFELLLIFLLVAFAAYGRVIGRHSKLSARGKSLLVSLSFSLSLSLSL
jgi:chorismate-pyruvate lyase